MWKNEVISSQLSCDRCFNPLAPLVKGLIYRSEVSLDHRFSLNYQMSITLKQSSELMFLLKANDWVSLICYSRAVNA